MNLGGSGKPCKQGNFEKVGRRGNSRDRFGLDNEQILHFDNRSSAQLLVSLQSATTANSSLQVVDCTSGVAEALANLHLTSRCLVLDVQTENIQKLPVLSPVVIVELVLVGMCSSRADCKVLITT